MSNELVDLSHRIARTEPLSWEEAVTIGQQLRHLKELSQWAIGDLAIKVVGQYGSTSLGKFAYAIGLEKKTVYEYMRVADNYQPPARLEMLSFRHHQIALQSDNPGDALTEAHNNNWTTRELYMAVKEQSNPHPPSQHLKHEWVYYRRCLVCGESEPIDKEALGNHPDEGLSANHTSDQSSLTLGGHVSLAIRKAF